MLAVDNWLFLQRCTRQQTAPVVTRWGQQETRSQNWQGLLGALTPLVGNSYKGQECWQATHERTDLPCVGGKSWRTRGNMARRTQQALLITVLPSTQWLTGTAPLSGKDMAPLSLTGWKKTSTQMQLLIFQSLERIIMHKMVTCESRLELASLLFCLLLSVYYVTDVI